MTRVTWLSLAACAKNKSAPTMQALVMCVTAIVM